MATNLTTQVRGIAKVVTAVADEILNQKIMHPGEGRVVYPDTINSIIDMLQRFFREQATDVAREVGTKGKPGGQAEVPGSPGTGSVDRECERGTAREPDRRGAEHRGR